MHRRWSTGDFKAISRGKNRKKLGFRETDGRDESQWRDPYFVIGIAYVVVRLRKCRVLNFRRTRFGFDMYTSLCSVSDRVKKFDSKLV